MALEGFSLGSTRRRGGFAAMLQSVWTAFRVYGAGDGDAVEVEFRRSEMMIGGGIEGWNLKLSLCC